MNYYHKKKRAVIQHYGGMRCSQCKEETRIEHLTLRLVKNNERICSVEAQAIFNTYSYWVWLVQHDYPPEHDQVVLCKECIRGASKQLPVRRQRVREIEMPSFTQQMAKLRLSARKVFREVYDVEQ